VLGIASLTIGVSAVSAQPEQVVLAGPGGTRVVFAKAGGRYRWSAFGDVATGLTWPVDGPRFSLQTEDGIRANLGDVGFRFLAGGEPGDREAIFEAELLPTAVRVRQTFGFCADGRTLRVRTRLRALAAPVVIQRVGLLDLRLPGQTLRRIGPEHVSCPVVGDRIFAGVEHPSAMTQVDGDALHIAQHSYITVGSQWVDVPSAVFGAASLEDVTRGAEAVRVAFLRYLDTVWVKPKDMHIHYNNWWTMPVPFTEHDVLANIADLKASLYDRTGFFFDSYAMDMGWSDPHTVWQVNGEAYPEGFRRIARALAPMGCRPGLWVSPSSCYPPALDNEWLDGEGYETFTNAAGTRYACLARGGRYQQSFKSAVLSHVRDGQMAHVKFDGLAWPCPSAEHGHRPASESYQPIAEGLLDVFDALRAQAPDIALEPTCLGYFPSPWWLMHTPFVIGPFGDDCPRGVCPAPDWMESLTTARDVANLRGRDAFWMPSSALECFDIIVQCSGSFYNHAVMAVARGHWFQSTYINPLYMDADEWRFFAQLMQWARENRARLQSPEPFGGDPSAREVYGYAYPRLDRPLYFARNPWISEAEVVLPECRTDGARQLVMHYPARCVLAVARSGEALPRVALGPYETAVLEVLPVPARGVAPAVVPGLGVEWRPVASPAFERVTFEDDRPPLGPSWTSPDGDSPEALVLSGSGELRTSRPAELCLLAEGPAGSAMPLCDIVVDGQVVAPEVTGSRGTFYAAGATPQEDWQWFLAPLPAGRHRVSYRLTVPDDECRCAVFVRGERRAGSGGAEPPVGPSFPVKPAGLRPWSVTLVPLANAKEAGATSSRMKRRTTDVDGVYLDALDWTEATAGWGQVHRNASVMGTPMVIGNRVHRRGIGTHANSRITYQIDGAYTAFVATVGCDQEVSGNSVVFAVEGDGAELYRSPVMRVRSTPIPIRVDIRGVRRLTLVVTDGGDGIGADHADWAEAVLLR